MSWRLTYPAVVDEVTVRLVAALVLVIGVVGLTTRAWAVYAALAVDLGLRAAFGPRFSPLAQLAARWLRPAVPARPRPTAGPPKRFAACVGALLTSTAAVLAWMCSTAVIGAGTGAAAATGVGAALTALAVLMVVFPALEAGAGVCVGCLVFARLIRWGLVSESQCLECLDISQRRPAAQQA